MLKSIWKLVTILRCLLLNTLQQSMFLFWPFQRAFISFFRYVVSTYFAPSIKRRYNNGSMLDCYSSSRFCVALSLQIVRKCKRHRLIFLCPWLLTWLNWLDAVRFIQFVFGCYEYRWRFCVWLCAMLFLFLCNSLFVFNAIRAWWRSCSVILSGIRQGKM